MRKYFFILIIFLSLSSQIFSQSSFLDLYPLHIGNYWQYKITVDSGFNTEDTIYYRHKEIIKDTLLSNGEVYKKIFDGRNFAYLGYSYLRIDSVTGCIYKYDPNNNYSKDELLRDSLKMMIDDFFRSEDGYLIECTLVDTISLFGGNRLRKHFFYPIIPMFFEYHYSKGIGETYRWNYFENIVATEVFSDITYAKINGEEFGELVNIENNVSELSNYLLKQNCPNPFNLTTTIKYQIPELSFVTLKVYDVLGNEIATLVNEERNAGSYDVEFDANNLSSGIYFYRLQALPNGRQEGSFFETKKMILLK